MTTDLNNKPKPKSKRDKYQIEATDEELESLQSTLKDLGIDSIISYDMEHLNTKIDQFSIEKKEYFINLLQGDFHDSVNRFLFTLSDLEYKIEQMTKTGESDTANVNALNTGIQKIEDKNHRIELRNENKIKLRNYMKNLLDQLTISPSRKETLLTTQYIATSELVIVGEVLDNFVKFYKGRQKQDIDMDIVKEGEELIKLIINQLIQNFNANLYEYIKANIFTESNLFRGCPVFKNANLRQVVENSKLLQMNKNRISLRNCLLDRKFVVQKLNALFTNQEDLKKIDAFTSIRNALSKGLRDAFASEFNKIVELWEVFFNSNILNDDKFSLYLDNDTFLKYDAFKQLYSEPIYEANKFFVTVILNVFFTCDMYLDAMTLFFNERPMFDLEKDSEEYSEVEKIITIKVYESMKKNIDFSREKSILLAVIIYTVLGAIQDKLTNNVMGDFIQLTIKDIFEIRKSEDDVNATVTQHDIVLDDEDVYDLEEIGVYKISSGETKNFVLQGLKNLKGFISEFLNEQKEIISNYECEIRRIGILPIVVKTINFLKLLLAITNGIKCDFVYEIFDEFKVKLKLQIEKVANSNKKYTNIVLAENYHYIMRFFRAFSECGLNVDNVKFVEFEDEFIDLYNKYKNAYIMEIFDYQFKEFGEYYHSFQAAYNSNKSQIKIQNAFNSANFEKKVNAFLKEIHKEIEPMAKRVIKHYTKEEGLCPTMWKEEVLYFSNLLEELAEYSRECYGKVIDIKQYQNMLTSFNFNALYSKK